MKLERLKLFIAKNKLKYKNIKAFKKRNLRGYRARLYKATTIPFYE